MIVVMDDRPARAAERLGLRVKGTVGVLVQARVKGLVPRLEPILRRLVECGARVSPALLEAALRSVGES